MADKENPEERRLGGQDKTGEKDSKNRRKQSEEDRRAGRDRRQRRRRRGKIPFDARVWGFEDRRSGRERRSGKDRRDEEEKKKQRWLKTPLERDPMEWESDSEW